MRAKQFITEDWQKVNKKDKTDGMSQKAVNAYRRENPGSKLKTAVTTKPSKLKKGGKAAKRRSSYCSRSKGQMNMHNISCAKTPDKAICKARRRWNCEEDIQQLEQALQEVALGTSPKREPRIGTRPDRGHEPVPRYKLDELSDETIKSYKEKAEKQVKELEPHAKKGEYKDIAKRMLDRRKRGLEMANKRDIDEGLKDPKDNPCWKGYKPVGTKKKNGKTVPNCVPKESVAEGSGPKEKQKTPYRDINSAEYRAAAEKQKQQMAKDKLAEPGKKLLAKQGVEEGKQKGVDGKVCWDGYKRMGTKKKGGRTVDNCVKMEEQLADLEAQLLALSEEGKASRKLCTSSKPDDELGASQLASCKSQGLRSRDGNKSHKLGKSPKSRIKVGGHKIKGHKYGGPLPDWS